MSDSSGQKLTRMIMDEAEKYVGRAGYKQLIQAETALESVLIGLERDNKLAQIGEKVETQRKWKRPRTEDSSDVPKGAENMKEEKKRIERDQTPFFIGKPEEWSGEVLVVSSSMTKLVEADKRVLQTAIWMVKRDLATEQLLKTKVLIWMGSVKMFHAKAAVVMTKATAAKKMVIFEEEPGEEVSDHFKGNGFETKVSTKGKLAMEVKEMIMEAAKNVK